MYGGPLLKKIKGQKNAYRRQRSNYPSLEPSKKVCQVQDWVRNILTVPIVAPSTPVFSQTGQV